MGRRWGRRVGAEISAAVGHIYVDYYIFQESEDSVIVISDSMPG